MIKLQNLLAENMRRFNTKNLKESTLLTEATIDLKTMPQVAAATKFFTDAWKKQVPAPNYILGQYFLKTDPTKNFDTAVRYIGVVLGFKLVRIGQFALPILPSGTSGQGGSFRFEGGATGAVVFDELVWYTDAIKVDPNAAPKEMADMINYNFNQLQLKDIQTIYAASKGKPQYDTYIAQFKASTSPVKALLTGNAKAFFGV
jgi:hypothetical protein